ncbi:MAG: hypothetical protein QW520_08075 [Methanomassiliicoccales archaeon]
MRSLQALLLLSCLSVVIMIALSDPSLPISQDFNSKYPSDSKIQMVCRVRSANESQNGWVLELEDAHGSLAKGFLPRSLGLAPPPQSSIVEVILQPSDSPQFYFIRSLVIIKS